MDTPPANVSDLASFRWFNRTLVVSGTASMLTLNALQAPLVNSIAVFGRDATGALEANWLVDGQRLGVQQVFQLFRAGAAHRVKAVADHCFADADLDPQLNIRITHDRPTGTDIDRNGPLLDLLSTGPASGSEAVA